jgi:transcriptional regulator with XRE-family HTH domain
MENILGEEIYQSRTAQGLTQDQFGAKYHVTGPAIFKFEKGYVKPSLVLWLKMAKDFEIPEKRAVLMWVKSRLPEEYQDLIQIQDEAVICPEEKKGRASKRKDYSQITNRDDIPKTIQKDNMLAKELKNFLKMDEVWAIYKPTGKEINTLRDRFSGLGKGSAEAYREALRVIRMFAGKKM